MRILFISTDLIAGHLAYLLKQEGHDVKLYIDDPLRRENFKNLVTQTKNWKKELSWVGKDGLIIFDDVGYGTAQKKLREQGYLVVGGSELGDKLEQDRAFAQNIFKECGLSTVPLMDFDTSEDALEYVQQHPGAWVIKQNNHHYSKVLNYVGEYADGRDVIDMLRNYSAHKKYYKEKVSLQEKIVGVEIGIGRYFNGTDWVGPIEYNIEHPKFFPGDIGPLTSEMGTLAWLSTNDNEKLYTETLEKLKPVLQKADFRGDFEINCIVNENGAFPLEATSRFGSPIVHLHSELHESPWGEFLYALATGAPYDLAWKEGYGVVMLVAVPPFPYSNGENDSVVFGSRIYLQPRDLQERHLHMEEMSFDPASGQFYISDNRGYVLYLTGVAQTIPDAQALIAERLAHTYTPKAMFRTDIGTNFDLKDKERLRDWGYLL